MNRATGTERDAERAAALSELRAISSLLGGMAESTADPEVRDRLEDARRRVDLGIEELAEG